MEQTQFMLWFLHVGVTQEITHVPCQRKEVIFNKFETTPPQGKPLAGLAPTDEQ
jgi:hypothetical protein